MTDDAQRIERELRLRVLPEHGGTADGMQHHWNLTHCDSKLHAEAADLIARLRVDAERMDFLDTLRRDVVGTDHNGEPELLCHAWVVEMQHSEIRPALDELMAATAPMRTEGT